MKALKDNLSFGQVNIPPPSAHEVTAYYIASQGTGKKVGWKIRMYLTKPGTDEPLDVTGETLTFKHHDFHPSDVMI